MGNDELQHEVTVASFYIDPFETTQEEYGRLMRKKQSESTHAAQKPRPPLIRRNP